MAIIGAFDVTKHLSELNLLLQTNSGFLTAAARKALARNNLGLGAAAVDSVVTVAHGGTGGTTAATARTNLGAVNKAGDTMTGTLQAPGLTVGGASPGNLVWNNTSLPRILASVINSETGSNAGSDFVLGRFNDAGTLIDLPVQMTRSTGQVVINNSAQIPKLSMGASTGSSSSDLSQHLALFSTSYGLGVTSSRLNYVVPSAAAHVFVINGVDAASIKATGVNPSAKTVAVILALTGMSAGDMIYATNGRAFNGAGTQEGTGVGTGVMAQYNGTAWKVIGTNITLAA